MEELKTNTVTESKMRKHVAVVSAIHIGFGIIGLIGAAAIFFGLTMARSFIPPDEVPAPVMNLLNIIFISLPILIGSMSTLGLVGGIGLLSFQSWARYLVIVVDIIGLINIPIGTLKGAYSLWVLFQDETIRLFERK